MFLRLPPTAQLNSSRKLIVFDHAVYSEEIPAMILTRNSNLTPKTTTKIILYYQFSQFFGKIAYSEGNPAMINSSAKEYKRTTRKNCANHLLRPVFPILRQNCLLRGKSSNDQRFHLSNTWTTIKITITQCFYILQQRNQETMWWIH